MARAYAAFANGGFRIDGAIDRQPPARDRRGRRQARRRVDCSGRTSLQRGREARRVCAGHRDGGELDPAARRHRGDGHARRARRTARPPARRARPRTTATPGSSATRRSSSPRCGSATRTSSMPMTTEFHGDPVAGGTFPALIWKTFMERALKSRPSRTATTVQYFPPPPCAVRHDARYVLRDGQLELDNGILPRHARSCSSPAHVADEDARTASRTRSRCRASSASRSTLALRHARRAAARRRRTSTSRRSRGQRLGIVVRAVPAARDALVVRPRDARRPASALHGVVPKRRRARARAGALEAARTRSSGTASVHGGTAARGVGRARRSSQAPRGRASPPSPGMEVRAHRGRTAG